MKILVACEYSGIVRDAFSLKGHDAWSCDLLQTESELTLKEGKHFECDVLEIINEGWDMMIGFPDCTFLTVTANKYFIGNPERWEKRLEAAKFVWKLWKAPIEFIALENPVSVLSSYIGKPDQIIHPYYFGDPVPKRTCLWLKGLKPLTYQLQSNLFSHKTSVDPEYLIYKSKKTKTGLSKYGIYGKLGKGKGKERSKFYPGIATAMAEQWGNENTEFIGKEILTQIL